VSSLPLSLDPQDLERLRWATERLDAPAGGMRRIPIADAKAGAAGKVVGSVYRP
jgi:hypothetical protein